MNRQAQAVILLLLGGAVLRASVTDQYLNYVKPGLRGFLIAAAVLLLLTGAAALWQGMRTGSPAPDGHDHDHDHEHGHADDEDGHGHHSPRVAWLLLLPALGLLLVAPPALGSYAAGRTGTALTAPSDFAPLPAGDPVRIGLLDYASRAIFDQGRSLGDRRVQLTGFVMPGPDGTTILTRMIVSCCAADARPIKVALGGDLPPGIAGDPNEEQWFEVVGVYDARTVKDPVNAESIPYLRVVEAKAVATPAEQYES
ncbi:TIGR03943 family putative permease subunit [Dactylosporangium siamense]|uniref:Membrane protein n=1 Tax=Dactylosporangium siamense TaxID=685454 RepID=A0A919PHI9_9ACTN|nr:TIGR03943 family protein [Dactylosporangium siamense]GIG44941.1 membrane protein [Dactylosporangium siamense]